MRQRNRWLIVVVIVAVLQLMGCSQAVNAPSKIEPAEVTPIEGTDLNRLVLTEEAAKRLDIQTALVAEEQVMRKRRIGGEVVALPSGADVEVSDTEAEPGELLVRVTLSEGDLNQVDQSQPAQILPLARMEGESGIAAQPAEAPEMEEGQEVAGALYYALEGTEHDLAPGQRVRVELTLAGSGAESMVVPYGAVIYDLNGETWVYTSPEPLTFVRHPVTVDYIEGDRAILMEGPPSGTEVVMAGAAELFGEEFGVGH